MPWRDYNYGKNHYPFDWKQNKAEKEKIMNVNETGNSLFNKNNVLNGSPKIFSNGDVKSNCECGVEEEATSLECVRIFHQEELRSHVRTGPNSSHYYKQMR